MFISKLAQGKQGEELAVGFLKKKGFKIIDRNFRIIGGEIDIIAIDTSQGRGQEVLAFIEVKTRKSSEFGSPLEAITPWKLKALIKTAQFYTLQHKGLPESMRIDAVGITLHSDNTVKEIELVKNIS